MNGTVNKGAAGRWWLCGLLFFATVLSYLDRQTVAICAPALTREFNLSNEDFGRLLSAFRWAYAVAQVPAGWIVDHAPLRSTYALAVGFWSLAGIFAGWTGSVRMLAGARAALGVGEAFNTPCALRVTGNVLTPADRGLGNGLFNSGAAIGALVAPLIIGPIAVQFGWRAAFLVVGAAGFAWVLVWWVLTRIWHPAGDDARERPALPPAAGFKGGRERLRDTLRHPGFWLLTLVSMTINPCWYFCADWMPKYLHDQRGFAQLTAGLMTIPIFVGADLGNLIGGGLVKYLVSRRWPVTCARALACTLAAVMILPVSLTGQVRDPWLSITLLSSGAFGIMALMANYLVCLQDVSAVNMGFVAGVLGALGNVVGATVSPWIGRYVDAAGNYDLVFVLAATLPLASLAAILFNDRRSGRTPAERI